MGNKKRKITKKGISCLVNQQPASMARAHIRKMYWLIFISLVKIQRLGGAIIVKKTQD
jgi:hypothetical protein